VCAYNLRDLPAPRCPECGHALRLTVGTIEPYLRAWMVLVLSTCVSAGIGVFCAIITAKEGMPPTTRYDYLGISILCFMATIPTPIPAFWGRRRFLRFARSQQWAIAWIALVVTIALLIFFAIALH
jgi:hypothetical protein